jgi:aspartate/methionine/tyrosine aminotransferase
MESRFNSSLELKIAKEGVLSKLDEVAFKAIHLSAKIKGNRLGDNWVRQSLKDIQARTEAYLNTLNSQFSLFSGFCEKHTLAHKDEFFGKGSSSGVSTNDPLLFWRKQLREHAFKCVPEDELKGIFDLYFQKDLYGSLRDDSTLILSSGAKELPFFSPPAGVRVALDVANRNTWFGYSDSLGHIETRTVVAALERKIRSCLDISISNVALVQGGTQGLNTVLRFLKEHQPRGKCVTLLPTYAPMFEEIRKYYELQPLFLPEDYKLNLDEIIQSILSPDTVGAILSIPHNPPLMSQLSSTELSHLAEVCAKNNRFLIVDEVVLNHPSSNFYDVIKHPTTIIISSYSKRFAVAGLKLGHIVAHQDFISSLYRFASSSYGSPPSFLYLASTTICALEYQRLTGDSALHSEDVLASFTNPETLEAEYQLWSDSDHLYEEAATLIIDELAYVRCSPNSWKVLTAEAGSPNRLVSAPLRSTSYSTFLNLLRAKNVSIFPIDCMIPYDERHHLRFTTPIHPDTLARGLAATFEMIDELVAQENSEAWINNTVLHVMNHFGLLANYPDFQWLGHLYRVDFRLKQLAALLEISLPSYVIRAAHLHDLGKVWTTLEECDQYSHWKALFDQELSPQIVGQQDDNIWGRCLIDAICDTSDLGMFLKHEFEILRVFFNPDSQTNSHWVRLLDIADITSDFIGTDQITLEQLGESFELKKQQVSFRYRGADRLVHFKLNKLEDRAADLRELLGATDLAPRLNTPQIS